MEVYQYDTLPNNMLASLVLEFVELVPSSLCSRMLISWATLYPTLLGLKISPIEQSQFFDWKFAINEGNKNGDSLKSMYMAI